MKHFIQNFFIILSLVLISLPCHALPESKKPWTFLVYIAADNSLSSFGPLDINEMKKIGTNNNVNVLVYNNANTPSTGKVTQKLVIYPNNVVQDGPNMSKNSGDETTLLDAVTWAVTQFPSDHIALILWDHGSGQLNRSGTFPMRGVCYDDTTGNYLTDKNIQRVLNSVINNYRNGKKFDIVAFDACLMAGIEIAYALEPYANFMVASQETIPGYGFEYSKILSPFSSTILNPLSCAKHMVTVYGQAYYGTNGYTLSAIDLTACKNLVSTHVYFCNLLLSFRKKTKYIPAVCNTAAANSLHFEETTYVDLYHFYSNMRKNLKSLKLRAIDTKALDKALFNCMVALNACVIKKVRSIDRTQSHGLSIYYPSNKFIEYSYPHIYWSEKTNWLSLLQLITQ